MKHREFWIAHSPNDAEFKNFHFYNAYVEKIKKSMHVIEHAAYDELMQDARKLRDLLKESHDLHKFYGEKSTRHDVAIAAFDAKYPLTTRGE